MQQTSLEFELFPDSTVRFLTTVPLKLTFCKVLNMRLKKIILLCVCVYTHTQFIFLFLTGLENRRPLSQIACVHISTACLPGLTRAPTTQAALIEINS